MAPASGKALHVVVNTGFADPNPLLPELQKIEAKAPQVPPSKIPWSTHNTLHILGDEPLFNIDLLAKLIRLFHPIRDSGSNRRYEPAGTHIRRHIYADRDIKSKRESFVWTDGSLVERETFLLLHEAGVTNLCVVGRCTTIPEIKNLLWDCVALIPACYRWLCPVYIGADAWKKYMGSPQGRKVPNYVKVKTVREGHLIPPGGRPYKISRQSVTRTKGTTTRICSKGYAYQWRGMRGLRTEDQVKKNRDMGTRY